MRAPLRLREDPDTSQELRDDLAYSAAPDLTYDVTAGLATFHSLISVKSAAAGVASKAALGSTTSATGAAGAGFGVAEAAAPMLTAPMTAPMLTAPVLTAPVLTAPVLTAPVLTAKAGLVTAGAAAVVVKVVIAGAVIAGAAMLGLRTGDRVALERSGADGRGVRSPGAEQSAGTRLPVATDPPGAASASSLPSASPRVAPDHRPEDGLRTATGPTDVDAKGDALSSQLESERALRHEIALLGRIKALLESDPAGAYRLATLPRDPVVRDMLREEREALSIMALFALAERDRAEHAARRFFARYPRSPERARIEALLAEGY